MRNFFPFPLWYFKQCASCKWIVLICWWTMFSKNWQITNSHCSTCAEGVSVQESCCSSKWSIFSSKASANSTSCPPCAWSKSVACDELEVKVFFMELDNVMKQYLHKLSLWLYVCLGLLFMDWSVSVLL